MPVPFVHLCRNGHVQTDASAPGPVTVAISMAVTFQYRRTCNGQAGTGARSFSVAHGNSFPLDPGHLGCWSQVCTMETFTAFVSVTQRRNRGGTDPVSEVGRAG